MNTAQQKPSPIAPASAPSASAQSEPPSAAFVPAASAPPQHEVVTGLITEAKTQSAPDMEAPYEEIPIAVAVAVLPPPSKS